MRQWAFVAALIVSACASSGGVRVTEAQVAGFRRGETRYEAVVAAVGRPTVATAAPDGTRIAIYAYERVRVRPETFVPLVGVLAGGTEEESGRAVFYFDPGGTLTEWDVSGAEPKRR